MTDTDQPILIATDRVDDAETIARVLSEEFATVHVSTDSARCVQDFSGRCASCCTGGRRRFDVLVESALLVPLAVPG